MKGMRHEFGRVTLIIADMTCFGLKLHFLTALSAMVMRRDWARSGTPPRTGTAGSKGTASPKGSKPGTAKGRKAAKATKGMNELDNPRSQQSTLGNAIVYGLPGFRFA